MPLLVFSKADLDGRLYKMYDKTENTESLLIALTSCTPLRMNMNGENL